MEEKDREEFVKDFKAHYFAAYMERRNLTKADYDTIKAYLTTKDIAESHVLANMAFDALLIGGY